jgi:alpha-ketoglutarate-dependent taurine dioxygenase
LTAFDPASFELDASKGGGRADSWHTDVTFVDYGATRAEVGEQRLSHVAIWDNRATQHYAASS